MYRNYPDTFTFDLQMRCAMSIRNLICVVSNQLALVKAGCVEALVELAEEAQVRAAVKAHSKSDACQCSLETDDCHRTLTLYPIHLPLSPILTSSHTLTHPHNRSPLSTTHTLSTPTHPPHRSNSAAPPLPTTPSERPS